MFALQGFNLAFVQISPFCLSISPFEERDVYPVPFLPLYLKAYTVSRFLKGLTAEFALSGDLGLDF
jgi:hypothetical protein